MIHTSLYYTAAYAIQNLRLHTTVQYVRNYYICVAVCFIAGGAGASLVRDSFTVNLLFFSKGEYVRACSCGRNGLDELACPHVYGVLRHHRMEGSFSFWMKKWRLVETWQLQLGDTPSPFTSDMVLSRMRDMRDDGTLPSSVVPKIRFVMPGRPSKAEQVRSSLPKGNAFDEEPSIQPRVDPKAHNIELMKVAMKRSCDQEHRLPSAKKCTICLSVEHTAKTCGWAKNYAVGTGTPTSLTDMLVSPDEDGMTLVKATMWCRKPIGGRAAITTTQVDMSVSAF